VTLLVDAGPLYAQADRDEPRHRDVVQVLTSERGTLVTSQIITAEVDYLILDRLGVDVELAFLTDLAHGTYVAECLSHAELETARDLVAKYRDLRLGLADASLVVLAHRLRTTRILTFDERAFRVVRPLQGGSFTLLPADARVT
jgi:predicted nucleic acid-binding protein